MKFSIKNSLRWSVLISLVTFIMACAFTVASTSILDGVSWGIGMLIVIFLILIGIFFDILGLAAAAANEIPFHGMASEKVNGSKQAIYIVRNADRFSNFCNDVIGDITSVISGAAVTVVVIKLFSTFGAGDELLRTVVTVIFTAVVSALTVGGKAMGKSFAIHYSTPVVLLIGKIFFHLERRFHIRIFNPKRKSKSPNGKRGKNHARNNQST
ncbi:MAG: rane protein [Bacilli bacterium]|nr:rane protein [Bacilli bacterium]